MADKGSSSETWWLDHLFLDQNAVPTLVPRVYGIGAKPPMGHSLTSWDEAKFFATASTSGRAVAPVAV